MKQIKPFYMDGTAKSRYGHPKTALAPQYQGDDEFLTLASSMTFIYNYLHLSLNILLFPIVSCGSIITA